MTTRRIDIELRLDGRVQRALTTGTQQVNRGLRALGSTLSDVGDRANRAANRGLESLSGSLRSLPGPLGSVGGLLANVVDGFKNLPGPAKAAALAIGGIGLGAGLSILAAVNATNGALERYRELRDQAFDARLTFQQAQRARAAFGILGIAPEQGADLLGNALDELRRRRGEGLEQGPLAGLLEDVGIDARAAITGQGITAFRQGVELIREIGRTRGADRAAFAASEIFGGDIERLVPRLTAASEEELERFYATLERGATISEDAQRNLEGFDRSRAELSHDLDLLRLTVGSELSPAFRGLVQDSLIPLIREVRRWATESDGLQIIGEAVADAFRTFGDVLGRNIQNGNLQTVLEGTAGGIRLFADALDALFSTLENNAQARLLFEGLARYGDVRERGAGEIIRESVTGGGRVARPADVTAEDILGAPVSITNNITQQPGEDGQALAVRVNRLIEQSRASLPTNY